MVDPKTGSMAKKVARFLSSKQSAVIEVFWSHLYFDVYPISK